MVRSIALFIFFIVLNIQVINSQGPKREFRAVWVSTVVNIDWPSAPGLSADVQKEEVLRILDIHKSNGINAIILQVRPAADAIYQSGLEPWSRYLSGTQGLPPEPYYDPLKFWIEECHKRGMELHAWFNPYRIKQRLEDSLSAEHIYTRHPEMGWEYGTRAYFAPGKPEVWCFVTEVIRDVVKNYDIDAVHMDDYFYPYQVAGEDIPDSASFAEYGGKYYPDRLYEWRLHNVDTVIQMVSSAIKEEKPWVKFGISPFGVWRNRNEDPRGSETSAGTTNYDGLYADVIKWQELGWIDYLMPQLYWRDDHPAAPYSTLAYWWNDYSYGRAMYFGLAPYRIDRQSDNKLWKRKKFFLKQIQLLRNLDNVDGFGFFSSRHFFRDDLASLNRNLQRKTCSNIAVVPEMPWLDNSPPGAPVNIEIDEQYLKWDAVEDSTETGRARFFLVYYYPSEKDRQLKESDKIVALTGESFFRIPDKIKYGVFRVSALDRLNNESQLSKAVIYKK